MELHLQDLGRSKYDLFFAFSLCIFALWMMLSLFVLEIAAGLLVVSWLIRIPFDSTYGFRKTAFDLPVLLFILVRVLSVFFSVNVQASLEVMWKEVPFYALYFAFTQNLDLTNRKLFRVVLISFLVGGAIASAYGIFFHLTEGYARARSTTSGYMTLGMYLTAVLMLSLPFADSLFKRRYLYWGILVVLFTALLLTFNRTHIVITVGLASCFAVIREKRLVLGIFLIVLVALAVSPNLLDRLLTLASPVANSSDRSVSWSDAWSRMFAHPFLGYGPHTFRNVFAGFDMVGDKLVAGWHNDYLQIPLESGFGALLSFLWIMTGSLYYCFRHKPWRSRSWEASISLGVGGMLIAFYASSFFGASAQDVITSQLFKFALAVSALLPAMQHERMAL
jgi:hypothetical protein